MNIAKAAAGAIIALSVNTVALSAQDLNQVQAPAEFPPQSFQGRQYVDSRGCVFIRAGIAGSTTWVPRVTRDRKLICGQTPTIPRRVAAAPEKTAPPPATDRAVEAARRVSVVSPARTPSKEERASQVTRAAVAVPAPKPVQTVTKTHVQAAAVKNPVANTTVKPKAKKTVVTKAPVVTPAVRTEPVAAQPATSVSQRVLPKHVYEQRRAEGTVTVPKGFIPVWEDDRLNPRRAEGTLAGHARMKLVWTSTVPRRLIDRTSGRDVTAKMPLVYPYTDLSKQEREFGKVTLVKRNGTLMKRVQRKAVAKAAVERRVSIRSGQPKVAAKQTVKAAQQTKRYVQVGAFGDAANAKNAARRLQAAGLPARIGKVKRKGKLLQLVVAGPFASVETTQSALRTAKASGFRDAFVRK